MVQKMIDQFSEFSIKGLIFWRIKNHPFWTSVLKGYYFGLIIFLLLTIMRISKSEAILATFVQDIKLFLVIGSVAAVALLTFTCIHQFYFPDQE